MNFDSFHFNPQVQAGIRHVGYIEPTPIQEQTIPQALNGKDVLGLAQTGTGKTAAFVLPILQRLSEGPRGAVRALILSPTRELAEQTREAIRDLGRQTGLNSLTIYGGVNAGPQIKGLRRGVEIVVACPGRLLDLLGRREISLSGVEIVVLDEADRMFDMGFLPDVRRILAALPKKRQTMLFSATMPPEIRTLATDLLYRPALVEIGDSKPVDTVSHAIYPTGAEHKMDMLQRLLQQSGRGQVLVFTRTKHRARKLATQLAKAGFSTAGLQGDMAQSKRQEAMDRFRSGRVRIMVATDIAARGIDVSEITHVINFDMPDTAEAYTHRIGRTGRMARSGEAVSLVTQEDLPMIRTIERILGVHLERRELEGFSVAPLQEQNETYRYQSSRSRPIMATRSSRRRGFRSLAIAK